MESSENTQEYADKLLKSGRCGNNVKHDSHWWGPNKVFWCDGKPK